MSDAQALADLRAAIQTRDGREPYGWKVAINATSAQRRLGLSRSLAAPIDGARIEASGALCSYATSSHIYLEAELGLLLGSDVTQALSLPELRSCIAAYVPCLELVDYALPKRDLKSMLAHSFFHAGVVLGSQRSAQDFVAVAPPFPQVLAAGKVVRSRAEDAVPDDVAVVLQQLAEWVLAAGGTLRRGQLVMCGSYIEPVPFPSGASLCVEYGIPYQAISLTRA
jgi:2-keto-4-pentenoate hydratase